MLSRQTKLTVCSQIEPKLSLLTTKIKKTLFDIVSVDFIKKKKEYEIHTVCEPRTTATKIISY